MTVENNNPFWLDRCDAMWIPYAGINATIWCQLITKVNATRCEQRQYIREIGIPLYMLYLSYRFPWCEAVYDLVQGELV